MDLVDRLTDPTDGGLLPRWGLGLVVAVGLLGYGISWLLFPRANLSFPRSARFGGGQNILTLDGTNIPAAIGMLLVFAALFVHFHWFWGSDRRLSRYYEPLQTLSLIGAVVTLIYSIVACATAM